MSLLTADIRFHGTGGTEHRKGVLMMPNPGPGFPVPISRCTRGSDIPASPRGEGRRQHEVQANQTSPKRARIVKRASTFTCGFPTAEIFSSPAAP